MDKNTNLFVGIIRALGETRKCVFTKCKKQFDESRKNKYAIEIEKLEKQRKENKIDAITFVNKKTLLGIKIIEEKHREELIKCQLKKCYDQTTQMIKTSIEGLTMEQHKGTPSYNIACKYKKIFEKNNYTLTAEIIDQLDADIMKTKLKPKQSKPKAEAKPKH
jgi:hypothetical protein